MRFALLFILLPVVFGCKKEDKNSLSQEASPKSLKESEIGQMPGISLWLKADSVGATDQSTVAEWKDSVNPARIFSQSDADSQPKYIAGGINNLPQIAFDGFNDSLVSSSFKLADIAEKNRLTVFAVTIIKSVSTNDANPWLNNPIFIDQKGQFGITLNESSFLFFNYVNTNTVVSNPLETNKPVLVTAALENNLLTMKANNNPAQENKTEGIADLDSSIFLGGGPNGSDYLDGSISEILFFKDITGEIRERVKNYLIQKYNLK